MDRPGVVLFAESMTPIPPSPVHTDQAGNGPTVVLGGTGKTGRRVAAGLRARRIPVRIGSRSGTPAFDWHRPGTWTPVLAGAASVYLAYSPDAGFPGADDTIGALAAQAVRAGVRRMVVLTGRGEPGALRSERAVQSSGIDWTIVRSSFFAQNFSEDIFVDALNSGTLAFPAGDVAEPFIDVQDIADIAVTALTEQGHSGQIYEVTGPRLITFAAAVAEISRAIGCEIRYVPVLPGEYRAGLIDAGAPVEFAEPFSDLLADVLDGRNAHLNDGVQRALGRPPREFSDYVARAAADGVWNSTVAVGR